MASVEQNDVDIAVQRQRQRTREPKLPQIWVRGKRQIDIGVGSKSARRCERAEDPDLIKSIFRGMRVEPGQQIGQDSVPLNLVRRTPSLDCGVPKGKLCVFARHVWL